MKVFALGAKHPNRPFSLSPYGVSGSAIRVQYIFRVGLEASCQLLALQP